MCGGGGGGGNVYSVQIQVIIIIFFLALHLSLAGNLGHLTWVRLQQPQEQRYPFLTVCVLFLCVQTKGMAANAWDL